jgi:hypothetical protein
MGVKRTATEMNKKDRELYWLERARDVRPDLFGGVVLPREAPDFVLVRGDIRHGVEITRFVQESRAGEPIGEEQTGLQWKVVGIAKKEFVTRSQTQLRLGAVFRPGIRLRAARVHHLAREIADYFTARLDGAGDWTRATWNGNDEAMPSELSSVFATVVPSIGNTHWYPAQAGWVSNADRAAISRIISGKEKHVRRYREECDELSLLIVFEGKPHSARAVHAPEDPVRFLVESRFDRVFCLDVFEKRLVDLPISVPAAYP